MVTKQKISRVELDEMLQEAIMQVEDAGIEVPHNIMQRVRVYKARSYFGKCRYHRDKMMYEITISEYHLTNPEQAVMKTLVHEVLHTLKSCMNHGANWKRYADKVNHYHGYDISRTGTSDNGYKLNAPAAERNVRFVIECTLCKNRWERVRKSKLVTHYSNYTCGCGGELERIK